MVSSRINWHALTEWERPFWAKNRLVAGVDEVGRGPLAGPVVAAAVILRSWHEIRGLDDSKKLTEGRREALAVQIVESAQAVSIAFVGPRQIERINILEASRTAMATALARLAVRPELVLTDAMAVGGAWMESALIKGDGRSASIAAASIVAKTVRDRYMRELARQYPEYGFERHKGYATSDHRRALIAHGPSEAHRRTFIDHIALIPDAPYAKAAGKHND